MIAVGSFQSVSVVRNRCHFEHKGPRNTCNLWWGTAGSHCSPSNGCACLIESFGFPCLSEAQRGWCASLKTPLPFVGAPSMQPRSVGSGSFSGASTEIGAGQHPPSRSKLTRTPQSGRSSYLSEPEPSYPADKAWPLIC